MHAIPARSSSLVRPAPGSPFGPGGPAGPWSPFGPATFQESACSRARQAAGAETIRTQPPFGWRQALTTSSAAAAALVFAFFPTASAPPAARASAVTAASAASARNRVILMELLPVE